MAKGWNKTSFEKAVAVQLEELICFERKQSSKDGENGVDRFEIACEDAVNHRENAEKHAPDSSGEECAAENGYFFKPTVISLASGSRANCTLVANGRNRILIDLGLSCRMAESFLSGLGVKLSDIDGVFITHEHSDHVYGLCTLLKKYSVPVHMTEPSYLAFTRGKGFEFRDKIIVHPVEYKVDIGGFTVSSCQVSHDAAACVSYTVHGNGMSFCICTDLGYIPERVMRHICSAENVILESNHDVSLLKLGEYPEEVKRRIRSKYGHLSNEQCAEALKRLAVSGVKRVLLGHISPENNSPELALQSAILATESAGANFDFIDVAPRLAPIRLV